VLDLVTTPGNLNDSQVFSDVYAKVKRLFDEELEAVVADAGYKTPAVCKEIIDDGKVPVMPYKRPSTKPGNFKKYEYVYDEHFDCYLCPNNQILRYSTTNRNGNREYKSNPKVCANCSMLGSCTQSQNKTKEIERHLWEAYVEETEEIRHRLEYRELYRRRSETIERVFADAKEKHGMRYTRLRGLKRVHHHLMLLFAAMNLKKLALWKKKAGLLPPSDLLSSFFGFIASVLCPNRNPFPVLAV
jgi:hypothetical protein